MIYIMQIRNLSELLKFENHCIYLKELIQMYEKLTDPSFINKNNQEQTDYINRYKEKLNFCYQLIQRGELDNDNNSVTFLKKQLEDKQMRLNLYSEINTEPRLFENPIRLVNNAEFEANIIEGGMSRDSFKYKPPNSSSNSAIFNGYYKGKKCYFKTFTVSNSKRLGYEQRIYKYIQNRNEKLDGELQDNFVDIIDVFKIRKMILKLFLIKLTIN